MTALYKTTRQQEFSSLMEAMRKKGFKPADVARMLGKTNGAVSQYLSGYSNPSEGVLIHFRKIVADQAAEADKYQFPEPGPMQLHDQLDDLQRLSPDDFEIARTTINLLHKKLPADPVSSKVNAAAKGVLKKGAASVSRRDPK